MTLKKLMFVFQGFCFAVFTVIILTCLFSRFTVLNSSFHKKLFLKHNICFYTYNYICDTIDSLGEHKDSAVNSFENNLIKTIKSSISLKFVSLNLESIRNGMFKYFNGEKEFLPDVSFFNIDNIDKFTQNIPASNFRPLKKVNLSTILGTFHLNNVLNSLFLIKFFFFVIKFIPVYLSIFALFILFINLIFTKNDKLIYYMTKYYFIFLSLFCILLGILFIILPNNLIISQIPHMNKTLNNIIVNYISNLLYPISIMFFITSILSFFILINFKKFLYIFYRSSTPTNKIFYSNSLYVAMTLIIIICISYRLNLLKNLIKSNKFDTIICSNKNVLSVKDNTIYAIQVTVLDSKTKMPIPGIAVSMTGISHDGAYFNNMSRTNSSGNILFKTAKGKFYVDFVSDLFPPEYILPKRSQVIFENAKTIAIPVYLKYVNSSQDDFGNILVTILDSSNTPYPNIQVCFTSKDNPDDKVYSITNSSGVAVFKGRPGSYIVSTSKTKFPKNSYKIPNNFEVYLENGTQKKYIIKLTKI